MYTKPYLCILTQYIHVRIYNCMELIESRYNALISAKNNPDSVIFKSLFAVLRRCNRQEDALYFIPDIKKYSALDLECFRMLIVVCDETRNIEVPLDVCRSILGGVLSLQLSNEVCTKLFQLFKKGMEVESHAELVWSIIEKQRLKSDCITYSTALTCCTTHLALPLGQRIHSDIQRGGIKIDLILYTALLSMYAKCGKPEMAIDMWNNKQLYVTAPANRGVYVAMLTVCANSLNLDLGKKIHGELMTMPQLLNDMILLTALIKMYGKCGECSQAFALWEYLSQKEIRCSHITYITVLDVCTKANDLKWGKQVHQRMKQRENQDTWKFSLPVWNSLIKMYSQSGDPQTAIEVWNELSQCRNLQPDSLTYVSILTACANAKQISLGSSIHKTLLSSKFPIDGVLESAILNMYLKSGDPQTVVTLWKERNLHVRPNRAAYVALLGACANLNDLHLGKEVHNEILKSESITFHDVVLMTALISMYAKCGASKEALLVWKEMKLHRVPLNNFTYTALLSMSAQTNDLKIGKTLHTEMEQSEHSWSFDTTVWNSLINMYVKCGDPKNALTIWEKMRRNDVSMDCATFVGILSAAIKLKTFSIVSQVHTRIIYDGLNCNRTLSQALMHAFSFFGHMDEVNSELDVIGWGIIISAYGKHKMGREALEVFARMQKERNIKPDSTLFINLLFACSHSGLVDEALEIFGKMKTEYNVVPKTEHYACVVDALGRVGRIPEAESLIVESTFSNSKILWMTLLGACRKHGDIECAERASNRAIELDPLGGAAYVLMGNIYAAAGRPDDEARIRQLMRDRGVPIRPGQTWIEVEGKTHTFFANDQSHSDIKAVHKTLSILRKKVESNPLFNYDTSCVLQPGMEEQEKIDKLWTHSEKLAVGYGIHVTHEGETLFIFKNLRICRDCHGVLKEISKIVNRTMIVSDAKCFHVFKDGMCSCSDFW